MNLTSEPLQVLWENGHYIWKNYNNIFFYSNKYTFAIYNSYGKFQENIYLLEISEHKAAPTNYLGYTDP